LGQREGRKCEPLNKTKSTSKTFKLGEGEKREIFGRGKKGGDGLTSVLKESMREENRSPVFSP